MAEVFAGFICGFAYSIIVTPPFALWVLAVRDKIAFVRNAVPKGLNVFLISVPVSSFFFLVWTAMGLVFGMLLLAAEDAHPGGALGSQNILYTGIVAIFAFIVFFPFFVLVRPARRLALFMAVLFVAMFGWLAPFLAERG